MLQTILIKPASGLCNMQCDYCFYCDEAAKREVASYGMMKIETIENIIRKVLKQGEGNICFAFQGGEPTLRGLDFFEKVIEFEQKYNIHNCRILNTLQTNGFYTDEKWLSFILSQILQNSIKYFNKAENSLTVRSTESDTQVLLIIEDNGCGIKPSDLSRVFEKGFTGSNRKKTNATGMGLYLSKKLCCKLGLQIDLQSEENVYTRVTLTFPKGSVHLIAE